MGKAKKKKNKTFGGFHFREINEIKPNFETRNDKDYDRRIVVNNSINKDYDMDDIDKRIIVGKNKIDNLFGSYKNQFNDKQDKLVNIIDVSEKDINNSLKTVSKSFLGKKHDAESIMNEKYSDKYGAISEKFFKDFNINEKKFSNTLEEIYMNSQESINHYYSLSHNKEPKTSKFGNEKTIKNIKNMLKTKEGLLAYSMAYKQAKHLNNTDVRKYINEDVKSYSNIYNDPKDSDIVRTSTSLMYAINKLTIGQLWD